MERQDEDIAGAEVRPGDSVPGLHSVIEESAGLLDVVCSREAIKDPV
jgi:hypothetical protein